MLTRMSTAATTVPTSVALFDVCPLNRHATDFTKPMIPSPIIINVSSCKRSTKCVYLKLRMRQKIAIRKMESPSTIETTTLNQALAFEHQSLETDFVTYHTICSSNPICPLGNTAIMMPYITAATECTITLSPSGTSVCRNMRPCHMTTAY
jgi:hypothetical protein